MDVAQPARAEPVKMQKEHRAAGCQPEKEGLAIRLHNVHLPLVPSADRHDAISRVKLIHDSIILLPIAMSGFEVAGVVLGVLPLVIGALSKYREERGTIATLMKYGGLLDDLIHHLKEQKRYFYLDILHLLREARVPEILDDIDPPEERCVAVLRDARTSQEVMEYLGRLYEDFLDTLGCYETCLKGITSKLSNIARLDNAGCTNFDMSLQ